MKNFIAIIKSRNVEWNFHLQAKNKKDAIKEIKKTIVKGVVIKSLKIDFD